MESAISFCNNSTLAVSLSRNPSPSSCLKNAKIASPSSLLPNQFLGCGGLSSSSPRAKWLSSFPVQPRLRLGSTSIQCSVSGTTAASSTGNSTSYFGLEEFWVFSCF